MNTTQTHCALKKKKETRFDKDINFRKFFMTLYIYLPNFKTFL